MMIQSPAPTKLSSASHLQIGSRVSCSLQHAGEGIVFGLHGSQSPESVSTLSGGVGVMGGSARIDVVFLSGSTSKALPESLVRGSVQWKVFDSVATSEELQAALLNAESIKEQLANDAQTEKNKFDTEVLRLQSAAELAHLTQGDDQYSGKLAAQNLRKQLKSEFPGIKFSVRKTSYGVIYVRWTDGPTNKTVEALVSMFDAGRFDGMDDSYSYKKAPWTQVFGGAKYTFTERHHSTELLESVISQLFSNNERYDWSTVHRPTAQQFESGELHHVRVPGHVDTLQQIIRQALAVTVR